MTYGNIYELREYLLKNNLHFSKDFLEKIYKSSLQPEDFTILEEEKNFIELFLFADSGVLYRDISELFCVKDKDTRMGQFQIACDNPNILANKKALKLIAKQDWWLTMEQLRLACENPSILADEEALELIAKQKYLERMKQLR